MPTPFFYYSATYAQSPFTLTATTASSSQVVTIQRLTLNGAQILSWGDGQSTTITSGSTGTWPHTYASAGTYTITLPNARGITGLELNDANLGGLKTSQLRQSSLNYFYVTAGTASTISSADMSAWRPTTWALYSMPSGGTYTISSADMSAWSPTTWYLTSMPAGTYTISSADMSAWRPTTWALDSMPAGTYTISSADMSAWRPTIWALYSMPAGTYTISSADMSAWSPTTWYLTEHARRHLHNLQCRHVGMASYDLGPGQHARRWNLHDLQCRHVGMDRNSKPRLLLNAFRHHSNRQYAIYPSCYDHVESFERCAGSRCRKSSACGFGHQHIGSRRREMHNDTERYQCRAYRYRHYKQGDAGSGGLDGNNKLSVAGSERKGFANQNSLNKNRNI